MPNLFGNQIKTRRGFTMVEIMMVVMIIGMLLAVAAPRFLKAREGSYARTCQSNLKNVLGAKERWAMDNNKSSSATPALSDLVRDYLKLDPECPAGGDYVIGRMDQPPTCSIGGIRGDYNAHVLP